MSAALDPSLFSDDAIPADTRQIDDVIVQAVTGMPEWWGCWRSAQLTTQQSFGYR
jgi:hypothetical protein